MIYGAYFNIDLHLFVQGSWFYSYKLLSALVMLDNAIYRVLSPGILETDFVSQSGGVTEL